MTLFDADTRTLPRSLPHLPAFVATVGMAIGLQLLTTLPYGTAGIRVALSDALVLPLALFLVGWALKSDADILPLAPRRPLILFLGALSAVVTAALFIGRFNSGEWMPWPFINKWIGWWVLLAYFLVGALTRHFCTEAHIEKGLKALLVLSCASVALGLVLHVMFLMGVGPFSYTRLTGLFANPNAYGCALAVFIMVQSSLWRANRVFSWRVHAIGMGILTTGLIFSGSRSAWIGAVFGFLFLLVLRKVRLREVVATVIVASTLIASVYGVALAGKVLLASPAVESGQQIQPDTHIGRIFGNAVDFLATRTYITRDYADTGLSHRVKISKKAIEYWKESPIIGIGLGNFYSRVKAEAEMAPATIHTTALWLLTETGIIGLAAFTGFLAFVVVALLRKAHSQDPDSSALEVGVAAGVIAIAAASIGTELLYQRHIWWLVGMAVAYPFPRSTSPDETRS